MIIFSFLANVCQYVQKMCIFAPEVSTKFYYYYQNTKTKCQQKQFRKS